MTIACPMVIPTVFAFESEVTAWAAAVAGDGGSVTDARKILVNTLVVNLKADGVFTKLDRLWLMAAENTSSARRDIIAAQQASLIGSPSFVTDRGYTGGGGIALNTNFIPGITSGNYGQNSAGLGYWCSVPGAVGSPRHGWLDAGPAFEGTVCLHDVAGSNAAVAGLNQTFGVTTLSFTVATPEFVHVNRSGASASQLYVDGSSVITSTEASQSLAAAVAIYFLSRNFNGTVNQASDEQVAAGWISGSLTGTDVGNLYTRLGAYMDAVGVPAP